MRAPLLLALVLAVLGCAESAPERTRTRPASDATRDSEESAASALADLGYVDYADESPDAPLADELERGLVLRTDVATPGYALIVPIPEARAILVNTEGEIVHRWDDDEAKQWSRAELGPDGDLLVVGRLADGPEDQDGEPEAVTSDDEGADARGRFLARFTWHGEVRWRRALRVHHDAEWAPNGKILAIADEPRRVDGLYIQDDRLLVLSGDGEVERNLSLYDLLSSRPRMLKPPRSTDRKHATLPDGRVDLFHTNSCEWYPFDDPDLHPLGGANRVLVSVRHQDLVAVVDVEAEKLVWAWGPGEVRYQHEATWLADGRFLVFDNGTKGRGWSRVVTVSPTSGEIEWEYRAPRPEDFFSNGRGTSQRLADGNVLIASSNQAEVFQVTPAGDVVWRWVQRAPNGRLVVVRARHYAPETVEPWLAASRAARGAPDSSGAR